MKKNNGFTLIELMIVVAIIGVISAIAYPSYSSYLKKSKRADAKISLSKIADRQERFYLQNGTYTTALVADLKMTATSEEGYYTLAVDSADTNEFTATATAIGSQASDVDCETLSLNSLTLKSATAGAGGDVTKCW